jgi:hypothetical protein
MTSTRSASAASSGIDDAGDVLARGEANAENAPRHGNAAHDGNRRACFGAADRVARRSLARTGACLGTDETDEVADTNAATCLDGGAGAGGEDTAEVSGATAPGAGSG